MFTASLIAPVLDRPRLHSQSTPASINPIRTYVRNPMITLPSKYPTSWVQRCWYSLFGKCKDVGAAIYLLWTHMRFLFISKTFCSTAAAHNACASWLGLLLEIPYQVLLHLDLATRLHVRFGPLWVTEVFFPKYLQPDLNRWPCLWRSESLTAKLRGSDLD